MEVFSAAALVALIKKLVDLSKQLRGGDTNGVLTQLYAFLVAIGVIWLASASKLMSQVDVGGYALSDFDWAAKILAGLALGSLASAVLSDREKALDNTQSAALPKLFSPPAATVDPEPVVEAVKPRKPRAKAKATQLDD